MKKLPNTIKITRAIAGEPRTYSEEQFKKILDEVGALPAGKVIYQGNYAAFSIFGEEIPELEGMWHHYMYDGPIQKRQMTRELALRFHLEDAAWKYKKYKKREEDSTPTQKLAVYSSLEKACNILIKRMDFLESYGRLYFSTPGLRDKTDGVLTSLNKEILRQKKLWSGQMLPPGKGHQKDSVLYDFVFSLCDAWEYILENKTTTSSVSVDGERGGPLIRFIQRALAPLGINKTPGAVKKILKSRVKSKK